MKYLVVFSTGEYDGLDSIEFNNQSDVEEFLSMYSENPDFTFKVWRGQEVEIESVEVFNMLGL